MLPSASVDKCLSLACCFGCCVFFVDSLLAGFFSLCGCLALAWSFDHCLVCMKCGRSCLLVIKSTFTQKKIFNNLSLHLKLIEIK